MTHRRLYETLREDLRKVALFAAARTELEVDMITGMPEKGNAYRAEMLAALERHVHEMLTGRDYGRLVRTLGDALDGGLFVRDSDEAQVIDFARRDHLRRARVPAETAERHAKLYAEGQITWDKAKKANCWADFLPTFERIVDAGREWSDLVGYEGSPLNPHLDRFDIGMTVADADELFGEIVGPLASLARDIAASPHQLRRLTEGSWSVPLALQEKIGRQINVDMGCDFTAGRLNLSTHPSCFLAHPGDARMTNFYFETDPWWGLYGNIHEGGHFMLAQGMPAAYFGTRIGGTGPGIAHPSASADEAMARLWEACIGTSRAFAKYLCNLHAKEGAQCPDLDALYQHLNVVRPWFTRNESDPVTYNLHVALRHEVERGVLERTMRPADVFDFWRARIKEMLGLEITEDKHGPLQDIHWSAGYFGYFQTYAFGNVYSEHLWQALRRDLCFAGIDMDECVANGQFGPISAWHKENVYVHGGRWTGRQLIEKAIGTPVSAELYLHSLRERHSLLYRLDS